MGRLIAAVVILLSTLLGVRVVNSPLFQRNVALPFWQQNVSSQEATPQPRSTGASSEVPPEPGELQPVPTPTVTTPLPPVVTPSPNPGQLW